MDIQSIWESIELDKRQLKCLIDVFKTEPDAELQSLLKRNVEQIQAKLIQLVEAVDVTTLRTLPEKENTPVTPIKEPETFVKNEDDNLSHETLEPFLGQRVVIENDSVNISLSLNDLFRFSREWFDGDATKFNSMWSVFASIDNYDDAETYLHTCVKSSDDDETMADCLALLKRHYQVYRK